jgi:uncharacterized membrane protein
VAKKKRPAVFLKHFELWTLASTLPRMNRRSVLKKIPLRANFFPGLGAKIHWAFFTLFLVQFILVWLNLWTGFPGFGSARWPDGVLLVLTAGTVLSSLARQLPAQNVMLASVIIVFIAGTVQTFGAVTAIPFGPYVYLPAIGQRLFEPLPWAVPIIWLVAILCARGVGRLMLRPWRNTRSYGFWLMGITAALVVLFDFGLEPFATQVKHFWFWSPTRAGLYWYTTPWVNFLGWGATALVILAFVTPSLINKKPVKHPPDYHPLIIWLLLNTLFATGTITNQLWLASALVIAQCVIVTIFALRGAAW